MRFEVKSPDGRTVVLEGDTPPTDADLDEIFANLPAKQENQTQEQPQQQKTDGSILESSVIRAPVYAMQKLLDSSYNPIGIMAKGLNYSFGSGKYELPESLRPIQPRNALERAVGTGAEFAQDAYTLKGIGTALKKVGALGKGVSKTSRIAQDILAGGKTADLVKSGAGAGGLIGAVNSDNPAVNVGLAMIGGNPASVVKALRGGAKAIGKAGAWTLGQTTGTGQRAVEEAFKAGQTGNKVFLEHLRGKGNAQDIVDTAREGLRNIQKQATAEYRSGIGKVFSSEKKLNVSKIEDVLKDIKKEQFVGGFNKAGAETQKTIGEVSEIIKDFKKTKSAHTPEGFDALKQRLWDVYNPNGTKQSKSIVKRLYGETKNEIARQAPKYNEVMKNYHEAENLVNELEKGLSLNEKASADTTLRKLLSVQKDTVQTNFGNRRMLADLLEKGGAKDLGAMIAGQSMQSILPRGLPSVGVASGLGFTKGLMSPELLLFSPRVVGEGTAILGKTVGKALSKLPKGSFNKRLLPLAVGEAIKKGE